MYSDPICATRARRHIVSSLQKELKVLRPADRAHQEILLPVEDEGVAGHGPLRAGGAGPEAHGLVGRRGGHVDVEEGGGRAVERDGVADEEVA